jgi:hypothetical protein
VSLKLQTAAFVRRSIIATGETLQFVKREVFHSLDYMEDRHARLVLSCNPQRNLQGTDVFVRGSARRVNAERNRRLTRTWTAKL